MDSAEILSLRLEHVWVVAEALGARTVDRVPADCEDGLQQYLGRLLVDYYFGNNPQNHTKYHG